MQMVQFRKLHRETLFNPLHPKIIMHIFHSPDICNETDKENLNTNDTSLLFLKGIFKS